MSREWTIGDTHVVVLEGDLTEQAVDAIVNAANNELQHGGGVAGAISRRGGAAIQTESDHHGPIKVGEAAVTGAGDLPARYVIHAASMRLGGRTTPEALRSSMDHVFRLARERGLHTIAVPAVGTGIARLPMARCAQIMAKCVIAAAGSAGPPEEVRFVLFGAAAAAEFEEAFAAALAGEGRTGQAAQDQQA